MASRLCMDSPLTTTTLQTEIIGPRAKAVMLSAESMPDSALPTDCVRRTVLTPNVFSGAAMQVVRYA